MRYWQLSLLLEIPFIATSLGSIAGVTYMDNFDFEERYRNVYECDPFHWHPLHMPEHCAEMYENLIRSRLAKNRPLRIVKERPNDYQIIQSPGIIYQVNAMGYPTYEIANVYYPPSNEFSEYRRPPLSPYEKMFELIRKDVERDPSAPTLEHMPMFGPVAIYHQPISKKSENMIKKISGAYAKASKRRSKSNHGEKYYGKIEVYEPGLDVENVSVSPNDEKQRKADVMYLN